jgi:hypothetical protein
MVESVPFNVVNPEVAPTGENLIVLKGGRGVAQTMPQKVSVPVGTRAAKIHILGGVAGWGFPFGAESGHHLPAVRVRIIYDDGQSEDVTLWNGEQFADYVRKIDVPGSNHVPDIVASGQLRWFSITPKRSAPIDRLELESFNNQVAPAFVALTAQLP